MKTILITSLITLYLTINATMTVLTNMVETLTWKERVQGLLFFLPLVGYDSLKEWIKSKK